MNSDVVTGNVTALTGDHVLHKPPVAVPETKSPTYTNVTKLSHILFKVNPSVILHVTLSRDV